MKIGVRSHDFGRHEAKKLSDTIKGAGFETVQLAITKAIEGITSFEAITDGVVRDIKEAFFESDLEINVLGCYIEPSYLDDEKRLQQVEYFLNGIDHAKILNAPIVGTETTNFSGTEKERECAYLKLKDSVLRMVEKAERENIIVGVETVALHTMNTAELTRRLLDEVGSDKLKVIFDPVNLLMPDIVENQKQIYENFFSVVGEDIVAVHLKDVVLADGAFEWRNIGSGIVEYDVIFDWLRKNKPDIRVLREHVKPESAHIDIEMIKKLIRVG